MPKQLDPGTLGRVQVFVPHPDDESIGCGGLLARLASLGHAVQVVLVSDGSGAGGLPPGAADIRYREFLAALDRLGVQHHLALNFPDGALRRDAMLDGAISEALRSFAPDTVVMPSVLDLHRDHRVVALTLVEQLQQMPGVTRLLQYEIWCPLPATHIVDITAVASRKWDALRQHETALACGDYLTASEGLARYRGLLLGRPGQSALAEAYVVDQREQGERSMTWLVPAAQGLLSMLD